MRNRSNRSAYRISVCASAMLLCQMSTGRAWADYIFIPLDSPPLDVNTSLVSGINNNGVVAGTTDDAEFKRRGFASPLVGALVTFNLPHGLPDDPQSTVLGGINDDRVIVAHNAPFTPNGPGTPILLFRNGAFEFLPIPEGFGGTAARGINNAGEITGAFNDLTNHRPRGYVRSVAGVYTPFDATPTTDFTFATAINNSGTAVGVYSVLRAITAGFERTADGTITLLPTPAEIGGIAVESINFSGINDHGDTAGSLQGPDSQFFGFVRDAAGNFTLIEHPDNPNRTAVVGINNRGIIAGQAFDATGHMHPFVAIPRVPGDMNCDAVVNNFDIDPFVLALTDGAAYADAFPQCDSANADANGDGRVNNFDIDAFVSRLIGE